jgi:hypothetical protein
MGRPGLISPHSRRDKDAPTTNEKKGTFLYMKEYIPTLYAQGYPQDNPKLRSRGAGMAWFVAYRHSIRTDEAGVKFLHGEAEAIAEGRRLGALGYVVTNVSLTSKARTETLLAGARSNFEQPLLG